MRNGLDTSYLVALELACHPDHEIAKANFDQLRRAGDTFAITSQVLAEFIHIVTDPKRLIKPLAMSAALARAEAIWRSPEIEQLMQEKEAVLDFITMMRVHRLGRKRILDTMLAAAFKQAGISRILTSNSRDFSELGSFTFVTPSELIAR